ncbi:MAG: hypothetical protein IPO63_14995 [Bacteroidetes bacterium]|nr:hypothetical protein [Bacteroidota bacterium]
MLEENSLRPEAQIINFKAVLKKTNELTSVFIPEITIAPGSVVEGILNTSSNFVSLKVKSKSIEVTPVVFKILMSMGSLTLQILALLVRLEKSSSMIASVLSKLL